MVGRRDAIFRLPRDKNLINALAWSWNLRKPSQTVLARAEPRREAFSGRITADIVLDVSMAVPRRDILSVEKF